MTVQLSMMAAIDAALPYGTPCGNWWWHRWQPGDAIPPGWRPPAPGADYPKPRLPAGSPPGVACEGDEIDMEISKAVDAWRPPAMATPFVGIHQTRRLACGAAWARLEAWDRGLSHATVRDGLIEWGHVPGAGALVALDGRWTRLPAEEAQDAHWNEPGDAIPPGDTPPIAEEVLPGWDASLDGMRDRQIVSDVMEFLLSRFPPGIPFPWEGVVETHRYPDGAVWASLRAVHDGGPCHVTLRDGVMEWSEAPGYGLLTYVRETSTWGRLPAKETWDVETQARVPKSSTEALAAASVPPDVEAPETLTSALPDVEALETSASDLPDVAPEPAAPVAALHPSGGIAAFLHAHNLATNAGWEALAASLDRTTPGDVRNAVSRQVAGGSLSAGNAASLLARIEAVQPEAPEEEEAASEDDDYDPVYRTRRAMPPPPGFMEDLARKRAVGRARREEAWRPLQALVDAGLARAAQYASDRGYLLSPASDRMVLWYDPNFGRPSNVSLWITDGEPEPEILARVEAILGVTARRGATSIRLLEVDKP